MSIRLLQEAKQVLSKCGVPQLQKGTSCVPLYKGYFLQYSFASAPTQANQVIEKEITPPENGSITPYAFGMRCIQFTQPANVLLQIQLPDGTYLFQNPILIDQWAGTGSYRFLLKNEVLVPIGAQIQITVNDLDRTIQQSFSMLVEGSYKYLLTGAGEDCWIDVGCDPRYGPNQNQNIFAPCWAQGFLPSSPPGCEDVEEFTYASDIQLISLNGPFDATCQIQIESSYDFAVKRRFFQIVWDATVTGAQVQVKTRQGSGYLLDDDFCNTQAVHNIPWPHDWDLAAGDEVFSDFILNDSTGTGNVSVQFFLKGLRRKRK